MHRCCPTQVGTCVLFPWKSCLSDMSKTQPSTRGDRPAEVFHSVGVAPVAQLAEAVPIAPPQNLEAEESVLGAMMLSPGAIGAVSEVLDASDFYRESHAKIYRAAVGLYTKGEPVDAITLVDELEERSELENVGGRVRLHELAALVPATANAAHYARIVREMATLRGLINAGQHIAQLGWERPGETVELVDRAEQIVFELSQSRVTTEFSHIEDLLKESFERITALYEAGADVTGVPSGFRDLDRLTSGFQPGNLVIVAARPSMGKSALGLCIGANLALRHEVPVALFTLEMSKSEVTQRLLCSEAKVESQRLRTGKLSQDDWPRLVAAGDKLMKAPIWVDDTGSINMMEIRSKARRLKSKEPDLGLIIVDYLQLMTSGTTAENRVQEVSQISRQLKVLARDLDTPILAMSQLSRAVEQRHDKRPILSDLRESGSIEQDADLVMFVYRDEYYNDDTDQQGLAEIILSKHRNGPTGTEKLSFLKRYAKFADMAAAYWPPGPSSRSRPCGSRRVPSRSRSSATHVLRSLLRTATAPRRCKGSCPSMHNEVRSSVRGGIACASSATAARAPPGLPASARPGGRRRTGSSHPA
jgi:replicative DNA helicase